MKDLNQSLVLELKITKIIQQLYRILGAVRIMHIKKERPHSIFKL